MSLRAAALAAAVGVGSAAGAPAVFNHGDGLDPMRESAALALDAGLTPEQAVIAVAVGQAESSNRDAAEGDTTITDATWGPSKGRWQIRCLWADVGTGRTRDCTRLNEPRFNAAAMVTVSSHGTDWSPWSVWLYDLYLPHLGDAARAVADVTGDDAVLVADTAAVGAPPAVRTPGRLLANVWRILVDQWARVGRSPDPAVRAGWAKADRELFGDPAEATP